MRTLRDLPPLLHALAGAVVVAAVWFALAAATGLIFHLMPAAPPVTAAWILRTTGGGRLAGSKIVALLAATVIAVTMTGILALTGRPLDEPVLTGLAIVVGGMLGTWLLRSGGAPAAIPSADGRGPGHSR